jgi:hypothetical protein
MKGVSFSLLLSLFSSFHHFIIFIYFFSWAEGEKHDAAGGDYGRVEYIED